MTRRSRSRKRRQARTRSGGGCWPAPGCPGSSPTTEATSRGTRTLSAHRQRPAYRWSADCSVYLVPRYRSRGLGRRLYERLIGEVRDLGYVSLFAGIALPNAPSVGLHEAMGFRVVGVFSNVGYKLGSWRDVGWWQLPLRDVPPAPTEPRPWAS